MDEKLKRELNEQELDSVAGGVNAGGASGNAVGFKSGGATGLKPVNNTGIKLPASVTKSSKENMSKK